MKKNIWKPFSVPLCLSVGFSVLSGTAKLTAKADASPTQLQTDIVDFSPFDDACVNWYGRIEEETKNGLFAKALKNTASGFEVSFRGAELKANMYSSCTKQPCAFLRVYIDDDKDGTLFSLNENERFYEYTLASGLTETEIHTVKVLKATEEDFATVWVAGFTADKFYIPKEKPTYKIDVYGDSITAGVGVLGNATTDNSTEFSDGTQTYAGMVARDLNAQYNVVCMQGISLSYQFYRTDGYLMKYCYDKYSVKSTNPWDYTSYVPDLILINIGTNDQSAMKNDGDGKGFIKDYKSMIKDLRKKSPDAKIICIYNMIPMWYLKNDVEEMVKDINAHGYGLFDKGDEKVYSLCAESMSDLNDVGGVGHPGLLTNRHVADKILEIVEMPTEKEKNGCNGAITGIGGLSVCFISIGVALFVKGKETV